MAGNCDLLKVMVLTDSINDVEMQSRKQDRRKYLKSRFPKSVRTPRRQQTIVHYICYLPLSVVFQMPRMSVFVKIVPFWSQRQYNFLSALKKRVS